MTQSNLAIGASISLLFLLVAHGRVNAEGRELLRNPGFEDYSVSIPPRPETAKDLGWTPNRGVGLTPEVVVIDDKETAHSGSKCLRMECAVPATPVSQPGKVGALCQGDIEVKTGKEYRVAIWAKGVGQFSVLFYQYNSKGFSDSAGCGTVNVGEEWKQYVFRYTVAEKDPPITKVAFAIHVPEGAIVFVDDASLKEIE